MQAFQKCDIFMLHIFLNYLPGKIVSALCFFIDMSKILFCQRYFFSFNRKVIKPVYHWQVKRLVKHGRVVETKTRGIVMHPSIHRINVSDSNVAVDHG